ncbi:MAG: protein kinase [Gemmatales bacterium]
MPAPEDRLRFIREAQVVAMLKHPHIVQIYDVGEFEGIPYFTMELVEEGTLASLLGGLPLPIRRAAEMLRTLALAVQAAHQSGIIHRDLKPANILIAPDEVPKISDFGLARRLEDEAGLTLNGVKMGTPSYMAPEQVTGINSFLGPSVDIYSLGCVLYEMLTGRPPFRADSAVETQCKVLTEEPTPPSRLNKKVPGDLETICLKCLRKDPGRRYHTAKELADDLDRYLRGEPIKARPIGILERSVKWARRRPMAAMLTLTLLTLVFVAFGVGLWLDREKAARHQVACMAIDNTLSKVYEFTKEERWQNARLVMVEAKSRLPEANSPELSARINKVEGDLILAEEFERIRQSHIAFIIEHINDPGSIQPLMLKEYQRVFKLADFNGDAQHDAGVVRQSLLKEQMLTALDEWAYAAFSMNRIQLQKKLLETARLADPEGGWRNRFRDAEIWRNKNKLIELADAVAGSRTVPAAHQLALTSLLLKNTGGGADCTRLLREALRRNPRDFWLNWEMAFALWSEKSYKEATTYFRIVLAQRPENPWLLNSFGASLINAEQYDDGLFYLRKALAIDPVSNMLMHNLVLSLQMAGRDAEALHECERQTTAYPNNAGCAFTYGTALFQRNRYDEAIPHYQRAIQLNPGYVQAYSNLGMAHGTLGRLPEAEEAFRKTIELEPDSVYGHHGLCSALAEQRKYQECIEQCHWLIQRLDPVNTFASLDLTEELSTIYVLSWIKESESLLALGRFDEAISSIKKTLQLPNVHPVHRDMLKRKLLLCIQWKGMEDKFPAYLTGTEQPKDEGSILAVAEWFYKYQQQADAAVRLYRAAFAKYPPKTPDPVNPYHYDAACAAVLASLAKGADLTSDDKAKLRLQALVWFKEELHGMSRLHKTGKSDEQSNIAKLVKQWQENKELAGIRDQSALNQLPQNERQQWQQFWAEVTKLSREDPFISLAEARKHVDHKEWAKAAAIYTEILKASPTLDGEIWFECAAVQCLSGDLKGYRRTSEAMWKGSPGASKIRPYLQERACTLSSDNLSNLKQVVELNNVDLRKQSSAFWSLTEQGAMLCRMGRYREAIPLFQQSSNLERRLGSVVLNWLWLAIAHSHLGEVSDAQALF